MSGEAQTIKDKFDELTEKVNELNNACAELDGQKKALAKERDSCYEELRELGIKDPEDTDKLRKHIAIRKKKLGKAIDKKISEVEDGLNKLEVSNEQ